MRRKHHSTALCQADACQTCSPRTVVRPLRGRWEVDTPDNMALVGTTKQLDDAIQEGCAAGKLVVVNFFSPDCYGCKSLQVAGLA